MHSHSQARERAADRPFDVPTPWTPLSKAQCLLMAIQLRRVQEDTRRLWDLPAVAPRDRAGFE